MFLVEKLNKILKKIVIKGEIIVTIGITIIAMIIIYSYFLSSNENTRDAKRYADILKISDELKIYYSKNNTYPLPDNFVNITSSGEILTYQGYAGEDFFKELGIDKLNDPSSSKLFKYLNYYTYATDKEKQNFQLMAFYESDSENTYSPTSSRIVFSYGDKVGIAIENKTNRPIQETKMGIDILNTLESYSIYNDDDNVLSGDKSNLKIFLSKTINSQAISCLEIKNAGWNENAYYYINPLGNSDLKIQDRVLKVYCDMESDGGGWTRLYYKNGKSNCSNDGNYYNRFIIEKIFTKDFAVSDKTNSLKSEGSWILNKVQFDDAGYNLQKMANVANCKTPAGTDRSKEYDGGYLAIKGSLNTLGTWSKMFYGCDYYKNVRDENIIFNIGGWKQYGMTGEFIHTLCNNYSTKDNSITSRWDWDNVRTIWVR